MAGLFEKIFPRPKKQSADEKYFALFSGYTPVFTSAGGAIYEKELIRSAIHANANNCSKLSPEIHGDFLKDLKQSLKHRMNPFMTTSQFLYRLATILFVENTAFIAPVEDRYGKLQGYYPVLPSTAQMVESQGQQYLRFRFGMGATTAIEWEKIGVLTRYQYDNDIFGSTNDALNPTLQLIGAQNDGIVNGVKASASIRFLGRVANIIDDEDLAKARTKFVEQNLTSNNSGGIILTDNKITDIQPIKSEPFAVNADQMEQIKKNVFDYFGCNEKIIQNSFTEDEWNAYYEGCIEPIAIQLSQVMTSMTYSMRQIEAGNQIVFTSGWLQYASNATKKSLITELFDRGFLTMNEGRTILNMDRIDEPFADEHYIRKEYAAVTDLGKEGEQNDAGEDQ